MRDCLCRRFSSGTIKNPIESDTWSKAIAWLQVI